MDLPKRAEFVQGARQCRAFAERKTMLGLFEQARAVVKWSVCPSIGRYLMFYITRRPYSSLDRKSPDQV